MAMELIQKMADNVADQIRQYPVIGPKEQAKRFIKEKILRQKLAPADSFSWPNAMLGQGLLAAFDATGEKIYLLAVTDHLQRWKKSGFLVHYVDNVMNGSLALWTEELLLSKKAEDCCGEEEIRTLSALCREAESVCAAWLRKAGKTGNGILPYRAQHPDWLFADCVGMISPFLCRYGKLQKDETLLQLGIAQAEQFLVRGMDHRSGLPYHGYDEKSGIKCGIIGWGRACGWLMKGIVESLPWIPEKSEEFRRLTEAFQALAETVDSRLRPDGSFSWQLEASEGHRDTSAAGMIGAALERGAQNGWLTAPFLETADRMAAALKRSVTDQGTVEDCSGECKGFAEYPQVYGCYPWGNGSALEFLALVRNR